MHDELVKRRSWRLLAATATTAILLGTQPATAQLGPPFSGPTSTGDNLCMQQVFGGPNVTNSNRLNCTANDVRISGVATDADGDPLVFPESCIEGTLFDLQATFEITVTANSRYDTAYFFGIEGQENARTPGNECSLSRLNNSPATPGLNLDGDSCGDLNSGTFLATFEIKDVLCAGVTDPDNPSQKILKLPNCTSWHNNQGTTCNVGTEGSVNGSNFAPDTKSKCVCDDDFTVPVIVETAELTVVKDATPTSVFEPGQAVDFDVTVTNDAEFVSVEIDSVIDDIYGDVADTNNTAINSTDCNLLIGETLGPGDSLACTFNADVNGNAGDSQTDIVEVCGTQTNTEEEICGEDPETVDIVDVPTEPLAEKQGTVVGCTVEVDYEVTVNNNSDFDAVDVTSLTDTPFGDITTVQGDVIATNCDELTSVAAGSMASCTFTALIESDDCDFSHDDFVTVVGQDEDAIADPFSVDTNTVTVNGNGTSVVNP